MSSALKKLPEDREYLVLDNINLVHHVIHKNFHIHNPESDLYQEYFQEGCLWLVVSAIRFDQSLGFKFATYAVPQILGGIQRYCRDKRRIIKMPRNILDIQYLVNSYLELGMDINEVSKELDIDTSKVAAVYILNNIDSLDKPIENSKGDLAPYHELIPDNTSLAGEISDYITEESVSQTLEIVKKHMTLDHHKYMYEDYIYAILYEDWECATQRYLANKYGVSQPQVSRVIERGNKLFLKYYLGKDVE